MKKSTKLLMRFVITIIVISVIVFGINIVLEIKHKNKFKEDNGEWNWTKENDIIFNMLLKKYPSTNEENFMMIMNENDVIPQKGKDEKRILVVGDSFVYGYGGTNVNYTWWKQLNLKIKEAGYSNINVYGAGRFFTNTKDELEMILKNETLMKKIDPDLIIIGYVPNDPEERDKTNYHNLVKEEWEIDINKHPIYKKNPNMYYELVDRMNSLDEKTEYDKLVELGARLGFYRWDVRNLIIASDENLERYKNILKEVDDYIKGLNIPYFYLFLDNLDNVLVEKANNNVYNAMKKLNINAYYDTFYMHEFVEKYKLTFDSIITANPNDSHPGIVWNYDYGIKTFDILMRDYKFLFENAKMQDINELELNINDTMPLLNVKKIKKNVFEFIYPEEEYVYEPGYVMERDERKLHSNFLYYPIEKKYIKLNLEYPKKINKIIVTGENLKNVEIYVNTIDEEYGFDIDEAYQKVTLCKYLENNTYEVNRKITSINIVGNFNENDGRKIKIEFID